MIRVDLVASGGQVEIVRDELSPAVSGALMPPVPITKMR